MCAAQGIDAGITGGVVSLAFNQSTSFPIEKSLSMTLVIRNKRLLYCPLLRTAV